MKQLAEIHDDESKMKDQEKVKPWETYNLTDEINADTEVFR